MGRRPHPVFITGCLDASPSCDEDSAATDPKSGLPMLSSRQTSQIVCSRNVPTSRQVSFMQLNPPERERGRHLPELRKHQMIPGCWGFLFRSPFGIWKCWVRDGIQATAAATPDPQYTERGQGLNLHHQRDTTRPPTHGATVGTALVAVLTRTVKFRV